MLRARVAVTALIAAAILSTSLLAGEAQVLRVEEHRDRALLVAPWDPTSPQKLVRIDDRLYQQHAGRYFPVIGDRITARLSQDVPSWDALVRRVTVVAPNEFEQLRRLEPVRTNRLGVVDLRAPAGTGVVAWCELLQRTGLVQYAEVATYGEYVATQSDPRYAEQWALHNTGQTGGTPGADIDAENAWDLTAGDPTIVVAVVDSGVDVDHEDLAANVWHNEGEIQGNGLDDDGNGYVDDWEGWDFDNDDEDPRSTNYHGTHVAGIVHASGSNGIGVAGIAGGLGGPGVRGMALGVGGGSPNADALDDAILYAADNGAHVITISLSIGETQAINDALDYAYNVKDVFIDCAAGNSGSEVGYPASRAEVMAVGSTDDDDLGSSFSNPGPEVEVAAPGSDVLSTQLGNTYGQSSGTSFAAPYVGGLAGLIRSRNPGLAAADVRQLIIDSADDVDAPGFDEKTGHGRINAFQAVSLAANSDGTVSFDASAYPCSAMVGLTVSDIDIAGAGSLSVEVRSDTETTGETIALVEAGGASGLFRGTISVSVGNATPDGVLQVADGDTIVAEYLDADDGAGGSDVLESDTALVDCRAPQISGVGSQSVSEASATIVWTTDEGATSAVRYGDLLPPALQVSSAGFTQQHSLSLDGLQPCTTYRYEVESRDAQSNASFDDNAGAYYSFETWGNYPELGVVPCHEGQMLLDRDSSYGCSDSIGVAVIDIDLGTDPAVAETVDVLVVSSSEPDGEWVTLTEIGPDSNRFEGAIASTSGPADGGDGMLALADGDLVSATYLDEDDGQGQTRVAVDVSGADCDAPFLTGVRVTEVSATRAVVEWTTDEPATSRVEFGATPALGSVAEDPALVTDHRVAISAFEACDRAFFRVVSVDQHGEARVADAGGQPLSLNLNQIGGLAYHEDFETDTGWQLPGDWERGSPQGLGTDNGDPPSAWSGTAVIGNDLSGQGAIPGDYEPTTASSAVSPVFSTRQQRNLELIVVRKLGVTSGDEAGIYVITNSTSQAWTSNYHYDDTEWNTRTYDISALADNKQEVQLEFRLESDSPDHSFGWNLDEIIVKDATEPDYLVCGGCGGAPSFRGAKAAYDPDACGPGGLVVEWEAAPAWGTGTTGTYEVFRGTTSTFQPDASNRVASGLTGASWVDVTAPLDTPVWYVVRARNDESCAGGDGLDDGNSVRLAAMETSSLPLPAPVGSSVVGGRVGAAHVRLEWAPVSGADHYIVRRGSTFDFTDATEIGSTAGDFFEDAGAAIDASSYVYRVFAVDACGREE